MSTKSKDILENLPDGTEFELHVRRPPGEQPVVNVYASCDARCSVHQILLRGTSDLGRFPGNKIRWGKGCLHIMTRVPLVVRRDFRDVEDGYGINYALGGGIGCTNVGSGIPPEAAGKVLDYEVDIPRQQVLFWREGESVELP